MISRKFFVSSLLLVIFLNISSAAFTVTTVDDFSKTSLLNKIGNVRAKRSWSYPPAIIREQPPGASFQERPILEISSDNVNVVRYVLLDDSLGVERGYFLIRNDVGVGVVLQSKPVDREYFSRFVITIRALNARGEQAEPDDVVLTIAVEDVNDNAPIFDEDSLTGEVSKSASAGTFVTSVRATDADSYYDDFGMVRFYYGGNQQPPSSRQYFDINEQGQVSLLTPIDREDVEFVSFRVTAKDGIPGSGTRSSTNATMTIRVLKSNDDRPQFTTGRPISHGYEITDGELADVGTDVATAVAEDSVETPCLEQIFAAIIAVIGSLFRCGINITPQS